jgi:hypothetical protein
MSVTPSLPPREKPTGKRPPDLYKADPFPGTGGIAPATGTVFRKFPDSNE